jgi:hypothetical protein
MVLEADPDVCRFPDPKRSHEEPATNGVGHVVIMGGAKTRGLAVARSRVERRRLPGRYRQPQPPDGSCLGAPQQADFSDGSQHVDFSSTEQQEPGAKM